MNNKAIKNVHDIFENDELVLMKALYSHSSELSVGLKDGAGDIVRIVTICKKD